MHRTGTVPLTVHISNIKKEFKDTVPTKSGLVAGLNVLNDAGI
jgi:hypothetical protein